MMLVLTREGRSAARDIFAMRRLGMVIIGFAQTFHSATVCLLLADGMPRQFAAMPPLIPDRNNRRRR